MTWCLRNPNIPRDRGVIDLIPEEAARVFGDKVYDTAIPRNIRISEAPSHGKPVLSYDPKSSGALAYIQLGDEFIRRETLSE